MFKMSNRLGITVLVVCILVAAQITIALPAAAQEPEIATYAYSSKVMVFWDPSIAFSDEIVAMHNMYETLLRYDPFKDEFEYVLAKSYEKSEDGLTWTFHLREGVKFHTGGEMDAKAVKFSIDTVIEKGKGASFIWNSVDRIEVADKYTVKFHLKYPAPLALSAASAYSSYIFDPDHSEHGWFKQGNDSGTGPYTAEKWKEGQYLLVTKFEDYWRGWEGKHFDKVIFKRVPEPSTRRLMIEEGKADFTQRLPFTEIEALQDKPGVKIVKTPSFQNLLALLNTEKKGPMGNKLVRKALAYSLPYKDIVEGVLHGYGRQARGVVPYGLWGYSENVKQYTHSIETAKALLAEAGYPEGGFELLLTYVSGDEQERRVAELWKSELAKLNIDLKIRGMPWDAEWELGQSPDPEKRQDIFLFYWWPDYANPHSFLSAMFESEEEIIFNLGYYDNPVFDSLINKAAEVAGTNRDEAIKMYAEAQNILMEDMPGVSIYDMEYLRATRASLKGYVDNPAYPHVVWWYNCYRGK